MEGRPGQAEEPRHEVGAVAIGEGARRQPLAALAPGVDPELRRAVDRVVVGVNRYTEGVRKVSFQEQLIMVNNNRIININK